MEARVQKAGMLLGVSRVGRCIQRLRMGYIITSNEVICVWIAGVIWENMSDAAAIILYAYC